jgi:hypothetical protein
VLHQRRVSAHPEQSPSDFRLYFVINFVIIDMQLFDRGLDQVLVRRAGFEVQRMAEVRQCGIGLTQLLVDAAHLEENSCLPWGYVLHQCTFEAASKCTDQGAWWKSMQQ